MAILRVEGNRFIRIGLFIGLDAIDAAKPAMQIDIGAAARTERVMGRIRQLVANRAFRGAHGARLPRRIVISQSIFPGTEFSGISWPSR